MANFPPNSGRNSSNGGNPRSLRDSMNLTNGSSPHRLPPEEDDDNWGDLPEESLEHTSLEEKQNILNSLREEGADSEELEKLQEENVQLRNVVAELRDQLEQATTQSHELWEEREREFESMLEEKSEKIRELFIRLKDLEERTGRAGTSNEASGDSDLPDDQELVALSDELERERCALEQEHRTLDEDRKRFREDEEDMMRQMREMELQMSKERAELARQRNELQRLHSEIRHELELAQRDAAVNERLRLLQRRSHDTPKSGEQSTKSGKGSSGEVPAAPKKTKNSQTGTTPSKKKQSDGGGLFGRFFNRDK